jgi:hypothetical protein
MLLQNHKPMNLWLAARVLYTIKDISKYQCLSKAENCNAHSSLQLKFSGIMKYISFLIPGVQIIVKQALYFLPKDASVAGSWNLKGKQLMQQSLMVRSACTHTLTNLAPPDNNSRARIANQKTEKNIFDRVRISWRGKKKENKQKTFWIQHK